MKPDQFQMMISLQETLRDDAHALFNEYRTMRQQIIGKDELKPSYGYDYCYEPRDFNDDLPQPKPTKWERMLEHCNLKFMCFLGYESQYNSWTLPLRWLFDPNWKTEATAMLQAEAEKKQRIATAEAAWWEQQERETLARLTAKYNKEN